MAPSALYLASSVYTPLSLSSRSTPPSNRTQTNIHTHKHCTPSSRLSHTPVRLFTVCILWSGSSLAPRGVGTVARAAGPGRACVYLLSGSMADANVPPVVPSFPGRTCACVLYSSHTPTHTHCLVCTSRAQCGSMWQARPTTTILQSSCSWLFLTSPFAIKPFVSLVPSFFLSPHSCISLFISIPFVLLLLLLPLLLLLSKAHRRV